MNPSSVSLSSQSYLLSAIATQPLTLPATAPVKAAIAQMNAGCNSCHLSCLPSDPAHLLQPHSRSCVLVVDGDRLAGIVTTGDVLRLSVDQSNRLSSLDDPNHWTNRAIGEIMTSPVRTLAIADLTNLFVPIYLLQHHQIRHLPLVDEQGTVLGVISHDNLQQLLRAFEQLSSELVQLIPIANLMRQPVVQATPSDSIAQIQTLLSQHRVSSVVVVEPIQPSIEQLELPLDHAPHTQSQALRPVGLITEEAVMQLLSLNLDLTTLSSQSIMSPVVSVTNTVSCWQVWQRMQQEAINHVVVTDAAGALVGIVTQTTFLNFLNPTTLHSTVWQWLQDCARAADLRWQTSEQRYACLMAVVPVGIFRTDPAGHYIYVNDRWSQITGLTPETTKGSSWADNVHPDDYHTVRHHWPDANTTHRINHASPKAAVHFEYRLQHPNGQIVWVETQLVAESSPTGELLGYVGTITDISDRKQAELGQRETDSLRTELTILETMLDNMLAGYWDADLVKKTQYISPGFKRMFGYADHELPNSPDTWKELVFPEDLPKAFAAYQSHVSSHGAIPYQVELRYRHKNGGTVWIICTGRVIQWDEQGNPLRLIGCHIDISDRKLVEAQLRQQAHREHLTNAIAQRIRASLNLNDILTTTVGEVHQVLHCDRVLIYRLLPDGIGHVLAESVSPDWPVMLNRRFPAEVFPAKNYPLYHQGRIFALRDRHTATISPCLSNFLEQIQVRAKLVAPIVDHDHLWGLIVAHQCGHPREWQAWEIALLQQLSGQISIAIQQSQLYAQLQSSHHQLTHINAELIRATRLKDEFLANMSHELRTPLNAILGLSETLLEDVLGAITPEQRKAISIIERSGDHLLGLINDILDVSKIESGTLELDLAPVPIEQLCQSSLVFVKQQAFKKQIQLHSQISPGLGSILVDERRIRQVLINLLTNAVKFTPTGGQVLLEVHCEPMNMDLQQRVSVQGYKAMVTHTLETGTNNHSPSPSQYYVCFSVTDTGIGIAPDDQAKLFQPFVQVDSRLNRQYEGTGLGLALVKRIVELHHGEVNLQSQLGQGSCFTIYLPYTSLMPTPATTEPSVSATNLPNQTTAVQVPNASSAPLLLLVEDNESNVNTISNYLKAKGYRIVVAGDGQEAIAIATTQQPDLILMDIQMPQMDGLEAIHHIRQHPHGQTVPIIALTALAMDGDRDRCLTAGANEYLSKPVRLRELATTVQKFLDAKKAVQK